MPFGIAVYVNPDDGSIVKVNEMDGPDQFDFVPEFPDSHDVEAPIGLG